jgi:hypothetical protein
MHLEKKTHSNINNKNIVNVVINTSKSKSSKRKSYSKSSSEESSYESSPSSSIPFTNSANLQTELLRQSLYESPQIHRPSNPSYRIRDGEASFIDEGTPFPEVDFSTGRGLNLSDLESSPQKPFKKLGVKPKRSTKAIREALIQDYMRMGGNDPTIINSTNKKTIERAIKKLQKV